MTAVPGEGPSSSPQAGPRLAARIAAVVLLSVWIYAPAVTGRWIWDDAEEVSGNAILRDPGGLAKIWLGSSGTDYLPLKTTVQWIEWHLWGDAVAGYHAMSIALHIAGALLLWRLLAKLGVRSAWFGAILFAVHPVAVESVAWIAELKNTLSLPALLLAMGAYVDFDRGGRSRDLVLAWLWFTAAMLCKGSGALVPVAFLLYAWWSRGRLRPRDLAASAPFFAVSLALGFAAVWFQERRAIAGQDLGLGGFWDRCAMAGRALGFYAGKLLVPYPVMPVYARWTPAPWPLSLLPWLALAALAGWMWRRREGWGRHALLGSGFIVLGLLPVVGFAPMAYLRLSWVADHLAYVALAGAAGLAAAALDALVAWSGRPAAVWGAAAACAAALAVASRSYARAFRDDEAFWSYAVRENPAAWIAHNNLGLDLEARGRAAEAAEHYREAIRLKPDFDAAHVNLGNALARAGRNAEAEAQFNEALRARPDNTDARTDLGNLALAQGRYGDAIAQYDAVLRVRPADPGILRSSAEAHYRDANALGNEGRLGEAASEYAEALRLWPDFVQARANLGLAFAGEGRIPEAVAELESAIRAKPDYPEAHAFLGQVLAGAGRLPEAIGEFEAALRINPAATEVRLHLAAVLRAAGRADEAERQLEAARAQAGR